MALRSRLAADQINQEFSGVIVTATLELLNQLMNSRENEHLEFKEAKNRYGFEELVDYAVALANEGGGMMILGVSNSIPRRVVGSQAFQDVERTCAGLTERLGLKFAASELQHPDGRVVVFEIPPRHKGIPVHHKGAYWMRSGESLVPMTPDMLKRIFEEADPDFSSQLCQGVRFGDLDQQAIEEFRRLWFQKTKNEALLGLSPEQLITDAELLVDGQITYAALILLGSQKALTKYMVQSELVFEYRSSEASGAAQQRAEFRQGYFLFHKQLWDLINLRNDIQHFHDGLFVRDIKTFNEVAIREAIQNAIAHRDYRLGGSIFVRQFSRRIEIVSPGSFPPGINLENILINQNPRNRRIAETLSRCGLVERSGQGVNLMFEQCIKESKPEPDFTGTDAYQVFLTLLGIVQDPRFIKFLEQIGQKLLASFSTTDFILLDFINYERPVPDALKSGLSRLVDVGAVERIGKGRGVRYILSRKFYEFVGKKGTYTRKRGLDRETNKQLLFRHIKENRSTGSQLAELMQVLPILTSSQLQSLLREMKREGTVRSVGRTKGAKWYPAGDES